MIPKVIHYCWFGGKKLPYSVKKCIKTWERFCPDYEIIQWNENNYNVNSNLFMRKAYEEKAWAFVSDYARLDIIYHHGGIYLDTDVEILKPMDSLLESSAYFGIQQNGRRCNTGLGFGAEKENSVVKLMLQQYETLEFDVNNLMNVACPILNTKALDILGYTKCDEIVTLENATIYPSKYFDPISPKSSKNLMCDDTISIHHYSASWTSPINQFKRKILIALGEKRVEKIKILIKKEKNEA